MNTTHTFRSTHAHTCRKIHIWPKYASVSTSIKHTPGKFTVMCSCYTVKSHAGNVYIWWSFSRKFTFFLLFFNKKKHLTRKALLYCMTYSSNSLCLGRRKCLTWCYQLSLTNSYWCSYKELCLNNIASWYYKLAQHSLSSMHKVSFSVVALKLWPQLYWLLRDNNHV